MELTEAAVSVLVEYLYTGEIRVDSDISGMMDIAVAAHCFQLQAGGNMLSTSTNVSCRRLLTGSTGSSSAM